MGRKKKLVGITTVLAVGALGAQAFTFPGAFGLVPSEPPQKDMVVDKAMRTEAIESAIALLNQHYVFPEKAAALEKQLRGQMQNGDFDRVTSAEKFAQVLSEALQRDTRDKHLEVRYFEQEVAAVAPGQDQEDTPERREEYLHQTRLNFGFSGFTRLQGNIGLVDLHAFGRSRGAADRITAMMSLLQDTDALIVDLRRCSGGDPETVMMFASYLFDQPTHLNDLYWRDENHTDERWTTATVPGKKYGQARKVYLLTGEDTLSGCEDLAYALKNARRATLIGATTGGGAHAGSPQRLSAHFMMFVPSGRPINPITHTDWEGVGVIPDIAVSEKKALDVATIAALKDLIATTKDEDWKGRLKDRLAELD